MNRKKKPDQLQPLAGIYRVIQTMATERRLDSLLAAITSETQTILNCDHCRVHILDKN